MQGCSHKPKVNEWGFDSEHNWIPTLYGCTECDDTFDTIPKEEEEVKHSHTEYVSGCFACKVPTLQLNAGDAGRANSMSQKKWDKEIEGYHKARKQGIQPEGTTKEKIEQAVQASDNLGTAYNAEKMMPAKQITKAKAKAIKQMGV